ncbi:hypothetical protein [Hansschlegelia zhihuaiae]|uniref:DUF5683 domain-containing protein n=1 Tax=Hansschlegelia zhihuaiae TaxID=405005 RepID=A0A4Q0MKW1_9HYPH|nr:hypothetical protein [Hansschlegelia zhihuaiae]RXF74280.1 hypothetical protein EK403_05480 [Hansschlegelia zhihuaiae]
MPKTTSAPPDPRLVLLVAALLPGMGHVMIGRAARGLGFAFFAAIGFWLTSKFADPDASFIGRHAGGFFVWALSLPDAYRAARMDRERAGAA